MGRSGELAPEDKSVKRPRAAGETVAQWCYRRVAEREARKLTSASGDRTRLARHVLPVIGNKPTATVRRLDVETVVSAPDARGRSGDVGEDGDERDTEEPQPPTISAPPVSPWMAARGDWPLGIQRRAGRASLSTTEGYVPTAEEIDGAVGEVFAALPASLLGPDAHRLLSALLQQRGKTKRATEDSNL